MIAQSTPDVDWRSLGVVGAIVLGIVLTGIKRYWLFTWVHDRIVAGKDAEIALLNAELERERRAHTRWETMALTQAGVLEKTIETTSEIVRRVAVPSETDDA